MGRIFCAACLLVGGTIAYFTLSASRSPAAPPNVVVPDKPVRARDAEPSREHASASEHTPAPTSPPTPRHPGEELRADLEALDLEVQEQLAELERMVAEFSSEQLKWKTLDKSMATARAVNKSLLARNKSVVELYETKLSTPLERFRDRLKAAPAVYRKMAEERRALHLTSALEIEKRNYLAMAETCEAAALLCERRLEELFGVTSAEKAGQRERRANVVALKDTIANLKKLQPMHEKWEESFAVYPTTLESPQLSKWFDSLSVYGEDLDAFTKNVEALKDAMKRKAVAPKAQEEPKVKPADAPPNVLPAPAAPAPQPPATTAAATPAPSKSAAPTTYTAYHTRDGRVFYVQNR